MAAALERFFPRVIDGLIRRPVVAIAVFWTAVLLIQLIEWEMVTLCMLLALLRLTLVMSGPQRAVEPLPERCLAVAVGVAFTAQVGFALAQVWDPSLIDIPASVVDAGRALLAGANPYTSEIDHTVDWPTGLEFVHGFKYSPLMAVAYMPLGIPLGDRGIVLTNLVLQLTAAWLVYRLARQGRTRATGLTAALAYLVLLIAPWELFHQGVTDLAAVLPLLAALLYADRKPGLAGLCVGISLSSKLLPAGLLLPCCLPTDRHARFRYALAVAAGTVPLLLAVLWSPLAVWNNLVLFNLSRPPDATSWLYWAPTFMRPIARCALLIVYFWIAAVVWRSRAISVAERCGLSAIVILTTILTGPISHNNYQLWWVALASVVLAVSLHAHAPERAAHGAQCITR